MSKSHPQELAVPPPTLQDASPKEIKDRDDIADLPPSQLQEKEEKNRDEGAPLLPESSAVVDSPAPKKSPAVVLNGASPYIYVHF